MPAAKSKKAVFSTGVAKGRDLLDSAISTSAIDEDRIQEIGARTLGEVLRTVPGIRVEDTGNGGYANYTIRGLPLAGLGSKFLQFQEDGLPVLEFGDLAQLQPDMLIHADLNLSRIESIRGGSASTFASNSPGGVINFISKTGEDEGGSIQLSTGLVHLDRKRGDFEYGGRLSTNLRFHLGGYYQTGAGTRDAGASAFHGGQVKLNITRDFANGYVRVYAKVLDDREAFFTTGPMRVTGTDANPTFNTIANFDPRVNNTISKNMPNVLSVGVDPKVVRTELAQGWHAKSAALGLEAKFDIASWTFVNRMRYSSNASAVGGSQPVILTSAPVLAAMFGGPGAQFSYATGPNAGRPVTNPATLNGNGLASFSSINNMGAPKADYFVNDFRASRVWNVGGGDLTTTGGVYKAYQKLTAKLFMDTAFQDFAGPDSALLDLTTAGGTKLTQGGIAAFSIWPITVLGNRYFDADYDITAPYGSLNFHTGRLSVGGSVRYDSGRVKGQRYGIEMGGNRTRWMPFDINGDGVISPPERWADGIRADQPAPMDYAYHYLSYSIGVNFRVSQNFAAFARYSKGGRALAETIVFTPTLDPVTGKPASSKDTYNPVRQAEAGVKFRTEALTLNLTGFVANTAEQNFQVNADANGVLTLVPFSRSYRAYGAEFEGSYAHGPFSITAAATYTHAEIKSDNTDATIAGNTPRHQPKLIMQAMPVVDLGAVSFGSSVVYTGSSYAQDVNKLKMPAFTTVNAFVEYRPVDRITLSVNGSNLFNALGVTEVTQASIPADGIVSARVMNGRTVAAAIRFNF
ncbi:TonB-dependent receptor [Sphingomonas sp. TDK1]|uniref:TonB-dependent receptor n=1 Tax=Sphingomonas sp. TDK1 TaxID=453247 RepID=UPI0018DBC576|nr:TonB-dependent receptor [Sphingomonas sp. TDK1]